MDRRWARTLGLCLALFGCGPIAGNALPPLPALPPPPAPPLACRHLTPAEPLAEALAAARPGDTLCLGEGVWVGAVVVPEGVSVYGSRRSVIRSGRLGTTVLLRSRTALRGVTVDGSGDRFDVLDAAVKVNGEEVAVEGVQVVRSVFGILSEKSRRVLLRGNHVVGIGGPALGMRGDGIRLWETSDSVVEHNLVEQARDCVVWYSSRNRLADNEVRLGRYGLHFMYSHGNHVERNRFLANEVGIFAMYSRNLEISDNEMLLSHGSAGIGLGVKESGNLTVRRNHIAHNTQGLFLDNSPLDRGDKNLFEGNVIRLSEVGVGFLSSQHDNTFQGNAFLDNRAQVRVDGGGDALGVLWIGNAWSDYAGYDLDGDGVGDLPYRLRDLSEALVASHPQLEFLRGTPALAMVSLAGEVVPLLAPRPLLVDEHPRFRLAASGATPGGPLSRLGESRGGPRAN